MSFVSQFGGNQETGKHTGMKGINAALAAGMTINEIRAQLAREGVQTGSKATEFLAARPATSFIAQYGGNESTMANSGMEAVRRAQQAGLTIDEIRDQAAQEGVSFGVGAQSMFTSYDIQNQLKSQARQIQQQYQAAQQKAAEAAERQRRQMQIAQAYGQSDPADVRFSRSRAQRAGMVSAGATGAFGRQGLRIRNLNVSDGKNATSNTAGSFA